MFKKVTNILKFIGTSVSILLVIFIGTSLVFLLIKNLIDEITHLPNKKAIFFDLKNLPFSYLIDAALYSFLFTISLFLIFIIFFAFIQHRMSESTRISFMKGIYTIFSVMFLTLTLIFWLDEKGFSVATSIVSFSALLYPSIKKYWDNQKME